MPRTSRIFDSMAQAASAMNLPLSEVRRAKRSGATACRNGRVYESELRAWLRENPPAPAPRRPSQPSTPAPAQTGAAFALQRLEAEEVAAFQRMEEVAATGDDALTSEARSAWLRISESLRRHDVALESARRVSGEMLQKTEVMEHVGLLLALVRVCGRLLASSHAPAIEGATTPQIADLLNSVWLGGYVDAISHSKAFGKLPVWLKDCALKSLDGTLANARADYELRLRHFYTVHGLTWPTESENDDSNATTD